MVAVEQKDDLDQRLRENEVALQSSVESLERLKKRMKEAEHRLDRIEPHKVQSFLDSIEARVAYLGRRLQVEILKTTVLSEVARIYPQAWLSLVECLDEPDEWWANRENWTIRDWAARIGGIDA